MKRKLKSYPFFALAAAFIFGLLFWVAASIFEYIYFYKNLSFLLLQGPENYVESLITKVPPHSLFMRVSFMGSCLVGGLLVMVFMKKRIHAEEQLKKAHDELETRVQERTAQLLESNEQLNREVAERLRAENALRKSEQEYRSTLRDLPVGVIVMDAKKEIDLCNPQAAALLGMPQEQMPGKKTDDLDCDFVREDLTKIRPEEHPAIGVFSTKEPVYNHTVGIKRPDSEAVTWVMNKAIPVFSDNNELEKVIVNFIDVTELRHVEMELSEANKALSIKTEAAEAANRAKSLFLANMSHEIRTPLNAIIGFSDLLSSMSVDAKQKSYIKGIETSGKVLLTLINDVLDLSKIEAGKWEILPREVDIRNMIGDIGTIFTGAAREKGLDLIIDVDEATPRIVMVDEARLRQVLLNLAGNALKFTDSGYVSITAHPENLDAKHFDLCINVADTGVGIPDHEVDHIFQSFHQVYESTGVSHTGTGLGLTICKRLVEAMAGDLRVTSRVGKGSVFSLELKNVERAFKERPEERENTGVFAENGMLEEVTILVVDDIESNRNVLKEMLIRKGANVVLADHAPGPVQLSQKSLPDLILMDIKMPNVDGRQAVRELKSNPGTAHIPVIAVTASATPMPEDNCTPQGFDGFVLKPVKSETILDEISRILFSKEQQTKKGRENFSFLHALPENLEISEHFGKVVSQELYPACQSLKNSMIMSDVAKFGIQLKEVGHQYSFPQFERLGEQLMENVDVCDVQRINSDLDQAALLMDALLNMPSHTQHKL